MDPTTQQRPPQQRHQRKQLRRRHHKCQWKMAWMLQEWMLSKRCNFFSAMRSSLPCCRNRPEREDDALCPSSCTKAYQQEDIIGRPENITTEHLRRYESMLPASPSTSD